MKKQRAAKTFDRQRYIDELSEIIQAAMQDDVDLRLEAIVEGRVGLDEMSDEELRSLGEDCWDLDPKEFMS
jgi:hypothetical protein